MSIAYEAVLGVRYSRMWDGQGIWLGDYLFDPRTPKTRGSHVVWSADGYLRAKEVVGVIVHMWYEHGSVRSHSSTWQSPPLAHHTFECTCIKFASEGLYT